MGATKMNVETRTVIRFVETAVGADPFRWFCRECGALNSSLSDQLHDTCIDCGAIHWLALDPSITAE